jgi:hypothetical protein
MRCDLATAPAGAPCAAAANGAKAPTAAVNHSSAAVLRRAGDMQWGLS